MERQYLLLVVKIAPGLTGPSGVESQLCFLITKQHRGETVKTLELSVWLSTKCECDWLMFFLPECRL